MAQVKVTVTFCFETTPEELQKYLASLGQDVKLDVQVEQPQQEDFCEEVSKWGLSEQTKMALIRQHTFDRLTLQEVLNGNLESLKVIRNLGPIRLREIMEKRPPHH